MSDYLELTKPRITVFILMTTFIGFLCGLHNAGGWSALTLLHALLGTGLIASGTAALNMWYERDIDALMERTKDRPLPAGRMAPGDALGFAVMLAIGSVVMMGLALNPVAAILLAMTIAFYVFIYTIWLKRRTPQNIVIGGAAGAFPPLVGWAAVTGQIGLPALALFALIFFWTPPHFWALSLYRAGDYAKAGVPMLPVVAGARETKKQMLLYTVALWPVALAPTLLHAASWFYGAPALVLSAGFTFCALKVMRDHGTGAARQMFHFSLLYLFLLFALLVADRALGFAVAS